MSAFFDNILDVPESEEDRSSDDSSEGMECENSDDNNYGNDVKEMEP
jgi:hypothetical protein